MMKKNIKPKNCEIILNHDCNAKCVFCYNDDAPKEEVLCRMPFEDVAKALYLGREKGCWCAYFIGGEITLREDLPKIIALAKKMGYPYIQVMSNGIKLADFAYVKTLVDAGANLFRLSLHSFSAKVHDDLVQIDGAHDKVLRAIENIKKLKAEVCVNNVLNRLNYKSADKLAGLLVKSGITDFNFIFPHYTGMMEKHSEILKLSVRQTVPHLRKMLNFLKISKAKIENPIFVNLSPCNLPEAVHLMSEWENPSDVFEGEMLYHLDGGSEKIYEMKKSIRVKNESCRKCVYNDRCMGFEKWYFDMFGGGDFKPVIKPVKVFEIRPVLGRLKKARGKMKI